ncbi:MAG TPA: transposase [Alphaproteobacteria bacterium]|nr:transposase [Alphaproteobacteria bacterium]
MKAALDAARSGTGRPSPDMRQTVEAVVERQRNGAKWRAVPAELSPWKAAWLHIHWSR